MADEFFVWHEPTSFKERFFGFFNWLFHLPKIILIIIAICIILLVINIVLFTKVYLSFQQEQPSIVATVDNRKITKEQFLKQVKLEKGFLKVASPSASQKEIEDIAKEKIILQKILTEEAEKRNIAVSEKEIDQEIAARIATAGGKETIDSTLKAYHWTEQDFRQLVYFDLLEKKIRSEIEGWSNIEGILIWFKEKEERKQVQSFADWVKEEIKADKNLAQIFPELEKKVNHEFSLNQFDQRVTHADSMGWDQDLFKFILTLRKNQIETFDSGNIFIAIIHVKEKHEGVDWDRWLKEKRQDKKLSGSLFMNLLNKIADEFPFKITTVEAADYCSPPYYCSSSWQTCPTFNYCGPTEQSVCTGGRPYLCIPQLAGVSGYVYDPLGNRFGGAIVRATNNAICKNSYQTTSSTVSPVGYYYVALNCCSSTSTTITCSATGYNSGSVSIPAQGQPGGLTNGATITANCYLRAIPPSPSPSPSSSPSPSPSSSASPSPSPTPTPTPSPPPGCNFGPCGAGGCSECNKRWIEGEGCRQFDWYTGPGCYLDQTCSCGGSVACLECKYTSNIWGNSPATRIETSEYGRTPPETICGNQWGNQSYGPKKGEIQQHIDNCNYLGTCSNPCQGGTSRWCTATYDVRECICGSETADASMSFNPTTPSAGQNFVVEVTSYKAYDQRTGSQNTQAARLVFLRGTSPTGQSLFFDQPARKFTRRVGNYNQRVFQWDVTNAQTGTYTFNFFVERQNWQCTDRSLTVTGPAITPWIQVTGDVHSNTRIYAPGGP